MTRTTDILRILSVALTAVCAGVAPSADAASLADWFSVTFQDYAVDETLSDKGVSNGTWGVVSVPDRGTATIVEAPAGKALSIDVSECASNLAFRLDVPNSARVPKAEFKTSVYFPSKDSASTPPVLPSDAKVGFSLVDDTTKARHFYGYAADGWIRLNVPGNAVAPAFDTWYDIRFVLDLGQVSYVLVTEDGDLTLVSDDNRTSFTVGADDKLIRTVEFTGCGRVRDFAARQQRTAITLRQR